MRLSTLLVSALILTGCEVDFAKKPIADPGLARRIAQQRATLNTNPNDGAGWLALGDMFFEGEQYFDAADAYVRAENAGGPKTPIIAGLSNTYLQLGYYQVAIERLKKCFQLNRNEPMCLYALGSILESNGDERSMADARRAYLHFLAVASSHPKAAYVKSRVDQINARIGPPDPSEMMPPGATPPGHPATQPSAPDEPDDRPDQMPADHPPMPSADAPHGTGGPTAVPGHGDGDSQDVGQLNAYGLAIQKALNATQKNDIPAAQTAYREALKLRPGDPSARAGLAETYLAQDRVDDAAKEIEGAFDAHPTDPQVRWMFGTVMLKAGRRQKEAIEAWESLVEEYPDIAAQLGIPQRLEAAKKFMGP